MRVYLLKGLKRKCYVIQKCIESFLFVALMIKYNRSETFLEYKLLEYEIYNITNIRLAFLLQ